MIPTSARFSSTAGPWPSFRPRLNCTAEPHTFHSCAAGPLPVLYSEFHLDTAPGSHLWAISPRTRADSPFETTTTPRQTMSFLFGRNRARPSTVDLPKQARESVTKLDGPSGPAKVRTRPPSAQCRPPVQPSAPSAGPSPRPSSHTVYPDAHTRSRKCQLTSCFRQTSWQRHSPR